MQHIIKDFLKENNLTGVEFCRQVGITTSYLQRIYHRKRYPSRELCQRIYEFTAGEIHPMDLLEIEKKKPSRSNNEERSEKHNKKKPSAKDHR